MKISRYVLILLALPLLLVGGSGVGAPDTPHKAAPPKAEPEKPGIHLTIYNDNFALIKDRRELPQELKAGVNLLHFRDVAATLEPHRRETKPDIGGALEILSPARRPPDAETLLADRDAMAGHLRLDAQHLRQGELGERRPDHGVQDSQRLRRL